MGAKTLAARQRGINNQSISEGRVAKLNDLGFIWKVKLQRKDAWMTYYNELVEYKLEFGHCNVSRGYKRLGKWVQTQRTKFKSKLLSEMNWDLIGNFQKMFAGPYTIELVEFKVSLGSAESSSSKTELDAQPKCAT